MKISSRKKIAGIVFSGAVLVLILSILTPALGVQNKVISNVNTPAGSAKDTTNPVVNTGYGYGYGCAPHSPGYWKNHPSDWPVNTITIGGVTYTKANAIIIMNTPDRGDKTYTMFLQLVAAKLNVLMGCDASCVDEVIVQADNWMAAHPVGSGVKANNPEWTQVGEPLKDTLEDYNLGYLCW